ncbi:hypothetical protein KY321_03790 [Candidatus Woesearchaeota archaeon]|nr:hypothetical protein [Candidatus Woesearchaeota archaeon]
MKNSFLLVFLLFLVSCSSQLDNTISLVEEIDNEYNVKISDYSYGLKYFDTNLRVINDSQKVLNQEDFDDVISRLENLRLNITDEDALNYLDLRLNLYKAEKIYLKAERKPFTDYKAILRCSIEKDLRESYAEVREAIGYMNESIKIFNDIDFKERIDLPDNFEEVSIASNDEIISYIVFREDILSLNCNQSQTE